MSLWKVHKTPDDLVQLDKSQSFNDNLTVLIPLENLPGYPELLGDYTSLKDMNLRRSFEAKYGLFLAEPNEAIMRVLRTGYRPRSLLVTPYWLEILAPVLVSTSCTHGDLKGGLISVFVAMEAVLRRLMGFHPYRGAIASMERPTLPDPAAILTQSRWVLVLEGLVDHTNAGAAVRSAAACNYDAILITPSCADPLYRWAAWVFTGTIFQVPWARLKRWPNASLFHVTGFKLVALALRDDAVDLRDYARKPAGDSTRKVMLVAGTEQDGLRRSTVAKADYVVCIEMTHGVDSPNVAGACAVACWTVAQ